MGELLPLTAASQNRPVILRVPPLKPFTQCANPPHDMSPSQRQGLGEQPDSNWGNQKTEPSP